MNKYLVKEAGVDSWFFASVRPDACGSEPVILERHYIVNHEWRDGAPRPAGDGRFFRSRSNPKKYCVFRDYESMESYSNESREQFDLCNANCDDVEVYIPPKH